MDWKRWNRKEDACKEELSRVRELRRILGIENRSQWAYWFDMVTTGTLCLVGILFTIVGIPWVIEIYRNDPTLWAFAVEGIKYALIFSVPIAIGFTVGFAIGFLRKK
jgi:hypothetical protein